MAVGVFSYSAVSGWAVGVVVVSGVVRPAESDEVVEVGFSAVVPGVYVVGFGVDGFSAAAGPGAFALVDGQHRALFGVGEAFEAVEVDWLGVVVCLLYTSPSPRD